jgi:hypothetical protein
MDLTKDFVKAKSPCADGFRWFVRNHQQGSDYQPVLDSLVGAGRVDDACWLLTQFGPTNSVLALEGGPGHPVRRAGPVRDAPGSGLGNQGRRSHRGGRRCPGR